MRTPLIDCQTAFPSALCQGLNTSVKAVAAAIEDNGLTPAALARSASSRPTRSAAALSAPVLRSAFSALVDARRRRERHAPDVVDDLAVDMLTGAEDRKTGRPLLPSESVAHAPLPALEAFGMA